MSAREDFTSEIFKIEIKNLAKFGFGVSYDLKSLKVMFTSICSNFYCPRRSLRSFSRTR